MHLWIDGYNLLFQLVDPDENFSAQRDALISLLSRKIEGRSDTFTLVFDGMYSDDMGSRHHHLKDLEILYSSEGQTADELIVERMQASSHPQREKVITSDKRLAWKVRRFGIQTEEVKSFIRWLKKGTWKRREEEAIPLPEKLIEKETIPPSKEASIDAAMGYYLYIFEKKTESEKWSVTESNR